LTPNYIEFFSDFLAMMCSHDDDDDDDVFASSMSRLSVFVFEQASRQDDFQMMDDF